MPTPARVAAVAVALIATAGLPSSTGFSVPSALPGRFSWLLRATSFSGRAVAGDESRGEGEPGRKRAAPRCHISGACGPRMALSQTSGFHYGLRARTCLLATGYVRFPSTAAA